MSNFEIKLARIERIGPVKADPHIRVTFRIRRGAVKFQVPIDLSAGDYDDTEMVRAGRGILHRTLAELAAQTRAWKLSPLEFRRLSSISRRPAPHRKRGKTAK
jgi:hypothetical protein